jgi:hypothetical protein
MPRFVILWHETPADSLRPAHYDLMLEWPARASAVALLKQSPAPLRTWACAEFPAAGPGTIADELADHRAAYLDYEGEVSGGRGTVRRTAAGEYVPLVDAAHRVQVRLQGCLASGGSLAGELTLDREGADSYRWRVSFVPGSAAASELSSEAGA